MFFETLPEDTKEFTFSKLRIDECFLRISASKQHNEGLFLYGMDRNCHGCPLKRIMQFSTTSKSNIVALSSQYPWDLRLRSDGSELFVPQDDAHNEFNICDIKNVELGEFGAYDLILQSESSNTCSRLEEVQTPVNIYIPLYFYMALLLIAFLSYFVGKKLWHFVCQYLKKGEPGSMEQEITNNGERKRVHSLDVFRGISIALMIFVNDGGGHYYFMEHATWNGLYVADLAFPWFMWIMGFCIPISFNNLRKKNIHVLQSFKEILRRSLILFALGIFWGNNGWINLSKTRVPGVLQRFALCYFLVGFILAPCFRYLRLRDEGHSPLRDITSMWPRWVASLLLIMAHTLITFCLPVPGCPTGYIGPGGLHLYNITSSDCTGGATGYLDKLVFTSNHIYSNPTAKQVYQSTAFDPEGLLGSLTSALTVLFGAQGGITLLAFKGSKTQAGILKRFVLWGTLSSILGGALSGFSLNNGPIPINKNLWSLSYVFVTSGLAFLLLAFLYFIIDVRRLWNGAPFLYAGMNSILLYLGHSTAWQMLPFHFVIGSMNTHFERLSEALWGVSLWLVIAYVLHRKKIYVTI